jgi:hypothetical protein
MPEIINICCGENSFFFCFFLSLACSCIRYDCQSSLFPCLYLHGSLLQSACTACSYQRWLLDCSFLNPGCVNTRWAPEHSWMSMHSKTDSALSQWSVMYYMYWICLLQQNYLSSSLGGNTGIWELTELFVFLVYTTGPSISHPSTHANECFWWLYLERHKDTQSRSCGSKQVSRQ